MDRAIRTLAVLLLALAAPVNQHAQVSELVYPGIEFNFKGDKLTVVAIKSAASGL